MPQGIKDKVAILGMGCSRFGERWDASPEDLMVEAYNEAMTDAGITPEQLDAAWFSTHMEDVGTGRGGIPMGKPSPLERTKEIKCPITLFFGAKDPLIPQEHVTQINKALT
ncbi:MAG: dienelactone hydrolase family protein, partial [Spongiibacter sp.]|nr:dienelactone hydrolase family protein [Spongiibacter sp.]